MRRCAFRKCDLRLTGVPASEGIHEPARKNVGWGRAAAFSSPREGRPAVTFRCPCMYHQCGRPWTMTRKHEVAARYRLYSGQQRECSQAWPVDPLPKGSRGS
jgi:hypothetical protein